MTLTCQYKTHSQGCDHLNPQRNCNLKKSGWHNCIEAIKITPKWSPSSISAFNRCKQLFLWKYLQNYSGKDSKAAILGQQFHIQIQKLYKQGPLEMLEITEEELEYEDYNKEKINAFMQCIADKKILPAPQSAETEKEFMFKYQDLCYFHGFIDAYLNKQDFLDYRIIDFKFTSRPENYTRFKNRYQHIIYMLSQNESKIALHLFKKPQVRCKKDEDNLDYRNRMIKIISELPQQYFEEKVFSINDYDISAFDREIKAINDDLDHYIHTGYFRQEDTCDDPFRCEFYDVCHLGADIKLMQKNFSWQDATDYLNNALKKVIEKGEK